MKNDLKRFIIRKYVMGKNAVDAIKKERKQEVCDVWLDTEWEEKESQNKNSKNVKGF